jgi:hypothetical protein
MGTKINPDYTFKHNLYSLLPALRVYKDQVLRGYLPIRFFSLQRKTNIVYKDQSFKNELFKIQKIKSFGFAYNFSVVSDDLELSNFHLKHCGQYSYFKRNKWNIYLGSKLIGLIHEDTSNITFLRDWLFIIPVIGESLAEIFFLAKKTLTVYDSTPKASNKIARIIIRRNLFQIKLELYLDPSFKPYGEIYYLGVGLILSLIEVSRFR